MRASLGTSSPWLEVLRTPQFAAIALTFFACCAAHSGPIFHMVSYAMDCGVPSMTAAAVFGAPGSRRSAAALCAAWSPTGSARSAL